MLDSIINYSDIRTANRLDAEYFQPKFLKLRKNLEKRKYKHLHGLCEFVRVGPAGSALLASGYVASGIKVYRPVDLNGWTCDNNNAVAISEEYCREKRLKLYRNGDILITRIGDIKFGIIQESTSLPVTISPNLIAMRVRKELLDSYFLLAFLNTKFGLPQIQRGKKIASLSSVGLKQIANIQIPTLPLKEQKSIGDAVKRGLKKIQFAKILYSKAEEILTRCHSERSRGISHEYVNSHSREIPPRAPLGRDDSRSSEISIMKLKDARRADAEYFLAQEYTIKEQIKTIQIGEIAQISRGIEPGSKAYQKSGKLFLRVSNISKYGLLEKSQKYISINLYEKLQKKYRPRIGEILLVKDGKPGVALTVSKPIEGIISDGIVRLKLDKSLPPEYIGLCINSPVCQSQIQAHKDGSLTPHWKIEQIKKLQIPVVPSKKRRSIINNVKKSTMLFQESRSDLNQVVQQTEKLLIGLNRGAKT